MIIEDAINIMKVVRGIVIVYEIDKDAKDRQSYQVEECCTITSFDYQIH